MKDSIMEQLMESTRQEWCECGDEAVGWLPDGRGLCRDCRAAAQEEHLRFGKPMEFKSDGKTRWIAYPISDNGIALEVALLEVKPELMFSGLYFVERMLAHIDRQRRGNHGHGR